MKRRDFLNATMGAAVSFAGASTLAGVHWWTPTTSGPAWAQQFRGSSNGWIHASTDEGRTWQPHSYFGSHCVIPAVLVRGDTVFARVEVGGHPFALQLTNRRTWLTTDVRSLPTNSEICVPT